MKKALVVIDPQNDFIISPEFKGALGVPGAYEDMLRIAEYVRKENPEHIVVTLDTHNTFDIAHNAWWVDKDGNHPQPFTLITVEDVEKGIWKASKQEFQSHAEFYVKKLSEQDKYKLLIWPDHCIEWTKGHEVSPELAESLNEWEVKNDKKVEYVYKGMNHKTEHYSALKAEVVLDKEEDTQLRKDIINKLVDYDQILITGEASSHCVGGTTLDLLENMEPQKRDSVVILKNCMSPVPGFESGAETFFQKAKDLNAQVVDWIPSKKLKIN